MQAAEVISILRAHEAELKAAGVAHLSLFGSTARGEQRPDSDVDLLAEFEPGRRLSLMKLSRIRLNLCDYLGTEVDLSSPSWLKRGVSEQALSEAIDVF